MLWNFCTPVAQSILSGADSVRKSLALENCAATRAEDHAILREDTQNHAANHSAIREASAFQPAAATSLDQ